MRPAALSITVLMLIGCHPSPQVSGRYELVMSPELLAKEKSYAEFYQQLQHDSPEGAANYPTPQLVSQGMRQSFIELRPDQTFVSAIGMAGVTLQWAGTYTLDGNRIVLKVTKESGKPVTTQEQSFAFDLASSTITMPAGGTELRFSKSQD